MGVPATAISVLGTDAVEVQTEDGALRARHVVVSAGPWTPALLREVVDLPPMTVTQEQPAHFAVNGLAAWPSFVHWRPGASESYGLFAPGEGVKVGFHGTGPVVDPDRRDFADHGGRPRALRAVRPALAARRSIRTPPSR